METKKTIYLVSVAPANPTQRPITVYCYSASDVSAVLLYVGDRPVQVTQVSHFRDYLETLKSE